MKTLIARHLAHGLLAALLALPAIRLWAANLNTAIPETTPTSDFELDNANGTAYHKKTGLTWKRCAQGQSWSSGTCSGTPSKYNWSDALSQGPADSTASFSDWRLPNMKELHSIIERQNAAPAINTTVFPNFGRYYWSATALGPTPGTWPGNDGKLYAHDVDFNDGGYDYWSPKSNTDYVLLVRGGKYFALSVSKTGAGAGTVTSNLPGIDCGNSCTGSFIDGMLTHGQITLTATPAAGSTFDSWTDCPSAAGNVCTVTLATAADTTVTAKFSPPITAPGEPASVTATGGNAQATVNWTAPTNDGGATVTGYNVQYSTSSGGTYNNATGGCAPGTTNGSTATSCTMTGLTNGTPYYFKVAAINSVGTGDYAGPASATPQAPVDGACGSANGTTVASKPSQDLCNAGQASEVTEPQTGLWSWSCLGSNGGTTQMCSAGTSGGIGDAPRIELTEAAGCTLNSVKLTPPPAGGPADQVMPYGVVDFELGECEGNTVTVKLTFTDSVEGHTLWKYGLYDNPSTGTLQWYAMPGAVVSGNTITYSITDNGIGDSDPAVGAIADPAGPGYPQAPPPTDIPTLSEWAQILTMLLLMLMAGGYLRMRSRI